MHMRLPPLPDMDSPRVERCHLGMSAAQQQINLSLQTG